MAHGTGFMFLPDSDFCGLLQISQMLGLAEDDTVVRWIRSGEVVFSVVPNNVWICALKHDWIRYISHDFLSATLLTSVLANLRGCLDTYTVTGLSK